MFDDHPKIAGRYTKGARAEFSLAEMMGKTIIYEVCHYGKTGLEQIL